MQNTKRMKSIMIKALIGAAVAGALCAGEGERSRQAEAMQPRSHSISTTHDGAYHSPFVVSHNGENIELEDGSIWSIDPSHHHRTKDWISADLVVIMPNSSWFSLNNHKLINLSTGVEARADLVVPPTFNGLHTYWIRAIDPIERKIRLNDGSSWQVTRWDDAVIKDWLINDTVIIGVNDGWFTGQPNILINVDTSSHARGKVIM